MTRLAWVALLLAPAAVGGIVGATVASYLLPHAPAKAVHQARSVVDLVELEELESRVSVLERSTARREAERRLIEASRRLAAERADGEVEGEGAEDSSKIGVGDPVFEAAVRDVVDRVRDEQANEREQRREQRRRQAASEWGAELAMHLGLTADQKSKVTQLALDYYEKIRDLWRAGSDAGVAPVSLRQRRERAQGLRGEYEERLGEVLDRGQMGAYDALEPDQKLGFRPARWGPRSRD
jgi:hypothetical protein